VGQRDAGRAREIANDLLTTHPDIDAVRFEAARILLHADRADQARAVLQDLVARRPEDAAVRSDYGAALFITGSAMEGLRVLEEAIALEPTTSGIYARLAEYLVILGQVDGAIASLTRGIEAAEERLPTLPLMLHLLWLRAFSRDRMGMRATVGMILLAIPAEDREAREQIASRLVALGQESDLRMLRRISDDCAHVLGALSRRDPDLYRDVARALADPAVPDWTLEIVFVSLMGSEGDENRARFKDVVRAVKRAGVHGCAARWERFREKHPHLGSRGGPLWRSVREATEGYG